MKRESCLFLFFCFPVLRSDCFLFFSRFHVTNHLIPPFFHLSFFVGTAFLFGFMCKNKKIKIWRAFHFQAAALLKNFEMSFFFFFFLLEKTDKRSFPSLSLPHLSPPNSPPSTCRSGSARPPPSPRSSRQAGTCG